MLDIWLFLTILVAIVIGYLLGRWQPFKSTRRAHSPDRFNERYAEGLNYLLADDSDNAIKIFTDLIEVNRDTIEIHLALANLFRSRGEVDRAIRIHQNLLARPNLTRNQRHTAIAELASDYLKAGLFDRAEKLYREMIELKANTAEAYRRLLDLYVAEKSWQEAVECAEALYRMGEPGARVMYSQCLCEIAEEAMSGGNNRSARTSLERALEVDEDCVRAALLLIQVNLNSGDRAAARKTFNRLIRRKPEFMGLYIEPARQIFLRDEPRVYVDFLQSEYRKHPSTRLAMALLEHYAGQNQIDKAREFLSDILQSSPSFEAFEFALRFLKSNPDQLDETWEAMSSFLKSLQGKRNEFSCSRCGYESHAIQWLCPSCRNWDSMKPLKA